jgi:hypothetical protein
VLGVGRSQLDEEKFRDMLRDGTERSVMTKIRDQQDKRNALKPTSETKSKERHERDTDSAKEQNESEVAPDPKKKRREDVNQAAFRVVRETTEKD